MRIVWLTDLHLDTVTENEDRLLFQKIRRKSPDVILISGDTGNGKNFSDHLKNLAEAIEKPVFFILGNHDFYYKTITESRTEAERVSKEVKELNYLSSMGSIPLGGGITLVGQDSWYDCEYGDYDNTDVWPNDFELIKDFEGLSGAVLKKKCKELALGYAVKLQSSLKEAVKDSKKIIILTHVPPFKECALYNDKPAKDNFLPFYTSKITGNVIEEFALKFSDIKFTVLSGHTHHDAKVRRHENLLIYVSKAEYTAPQISREFELKEELSLNMKL